MTAAVLPPLPPAAGGAATEPTSKGAPRPLPRLPCPEEAPAFATEGGGGITLLASSVPDSRPDALPALRLVPPVDGGGGTTLVFSVVFRDVPRELPEVPLATAAGGGTTF